MVWGSVRTLEAPTQAPARRQPLYATGGTTGTVTSVVEELCHDLFGTLLRRDQRLRARQYIRGLLETSGRKTIRNIAAFIGGPGIDQRLHHFISDSTWDWEPVRSALTRRVMRQMAPEVWVIRPVMIPKAGLHTVGVGRRFCNTRRKVVHAQLAVGVMAVSDRGSFPVNWRLQLPKEWLADDLRRARSALPDGLWAETLDECVVQVCRQTLGESGTTDIPVLFDGRDLDAAQLRILRAAGKVLTLIRIPRTISLYISDQGLAGHRMDVPLAAHQIVEAARSRRRLVTHLEAGIPKPYLVSTVDVQSPIESELRQPPLRLMAISPLGEDSEEELWLATPTSLPITSVLGLTRRLAQADRDLDRIAEQVGIWDFSGRSFPGWHRHVTLASAAHAAQILVSSSGDRVRLVDSSTRPHRDAHV
jgi:hypothetical protein